MDQRAWSKASLPESLVDLALDLRVVFPKDAVHQDCPLFLGTAPTILLALIAIAVIVMEKPAPPPVQIDPTPFVGG